MVGRFEKFIGEAVIALFGAPVSHEDDPERAVRVALAIRDFALEEELELRVGITTGEALVSLEAWPSEGEGMVSGDVVNTAAHLQNAAPVNGILTDETAYRATRRAPRQVGLERPGVLERKTVGHAGDVVDDLVHVVSALDELVEDPADHLMRALMLGHRLAP